MWFSKKTFSKDITFEIDSMLGQTRFHFNHIQIVKGMEKMIQLNDTIHGLNEKNKKLIVCLTSLNNSFLPLHLFSLMRQNCRLGLIKHVIIALWIGLTLMCKKTTKSWPTNDQIQRQRSLPTNQTPWKETCVSHGGTLKMSVSHQMVSSIAIIQCSRYCWSLLCSLQPQHIRQPSFLAQLLVNARNSIGI